MAEKFTVPVVGVGAVVWNGEHILLIRRGHAPRKGHWSLPGGHQNLGETVHAAVARELREETGVEVRILDVAGVVDLIEPAPGGGYDYHYTVIDVAAEWVSGEAVAGDDAAEVAWATRAELPRYQLTPAMLEIIDAAAAKRAAHRA